MILVTHMDAMSASVTSFLSMPFCSISRMSASSAAARSLPISSSSSCNDMRSLAPGLLRPRRNGAAAGPGRTAASGLRGLRARDVGLPEMSEKMCRGPASTAPQARTGERAP